MIQNSSINDTYRGYSRLLVWILGISLLLNYANYSFLNEIGILGNLVKLIRLPILFIPWLKFLQLPLQFRLHFKVFLNRNSDVILFIGMMALGMINTQAPLEFILYFFWITISFITILLFIFSISYKNNVKNVFSSTAEVFLICGSFAFIDTIRISYFNLEARNVYTFFLAALFMALVIRILIERHQGPILHRYILIDDQIARIMVLGICLFIFISSGRRSSFIMSVFIIFYGLLLMVSKSRSKRFLILLFSPFLILPIISIIPNNYDNLSKRYDTIYRLSKINLKSQNEIVDASYAIRQRVWQGYIEVFEENPIVGTGLASGRIYHQSLVEDVELFGERISGKGSHNTYLLILVETGLLGSILFIIIFLRSLYLALAYSKGIYRHLILLLFLPGAAFCWTEQNLYPGQAFFWGFWIPLLLPRVYLIR